MRAYIIRRLLLTIPTIVIVSFLIFLMMRLVPGTIVDIMVAQLQYFTEEDVQDIVHSLGFDVPVVVQYGRWLGVVPEEDGGLDGILEGNLGFSMLKGTSVNEDIAARWPVTFELGLMGILISQIIALPIGIYSALRQDTWGDYIGRSFAIICIAVPGFWVGTMIIVLPSIWWGYMPSITLIPFSQDPIGNLKMFIIPALVLGMEMSGATMRMTRTMMLEVLRQDYIRTAWAKGLRERVVILRHALKNALIPLVTIMGWLLPGLIGGTVVIENIFCLPGMGRLLMQATAQRDYTMVSGVMFIYSIAMVLINLGVDVAYAYLDPRVRYR